MASKKLNERLLGGPWIKEKTLCSKGFKMYHLKKITGTHFASKKPWRSSSCGDDR
jgi:hypothetical protein